MFFLKMTAI